MGMCECSHSGRVVDLVCVCACMSVCACARACMLAGAYVRERALKGEVRACGSVFSRSFSV